MDYRKQVFKMLNIEPDEEIQLANITDAIYRISHNLKVWVRNKNEDGWRTCSNDSLSAILTGQLEIVKIKKPTPEDQIVIDYAKLCGCKWIAKDKNGYIYAFINKPMKNNNEEMWDVDGDNSYIEIEYQISFLSWEDKEPYFIGE